MANTTAIALIAQGWKSPQEAIPALMIIGEKFADSDGLSISSEMLERFPLYRHSLC